MDINDQCVRRFRDIVTARGHLDSQWRPWEHGLESHGFARANLAAHQGDVGHARVETGDSRCCSVEFVLKTDLGMMFPETLLPKLQHPAHLWTSPNTDRRGLGVARSYHGRRQ